MKRLIIPAFAALFLVACNSEATSESTETESTETTETTMADPNAKIDPVCEMPYDAEWTEYSVDGTDTTWFCSEVCKGVYDKNPAKYHKG